MKIFKIWASASWSTWDVSKGYTDAIMAEGHELKPFRLDTRIDFLSTAFRDWCVRNDREPPPLELVLRDAADASFIEAVRYQPDWVLITSAMGYHPDALTFFKRYGFRTALLLTECPYNDMEHSYLAPLADYVFCNDAESVPKLSPYNPNTFYIPTAYNEFIHLPNGPARGQRDVVLVGTGFPERRELLSAVDWAGINLELWGYWGEFSNGRPPEDDPLKDYIREPIFNKEAVELYRGTKIALNMYRTGSNRSLNPRAYELAAMGVFQLAEDASTEARELFGDTIGYYETSEELEDRVHYYLDRPRTREDMAEAARAKVVGHSYRDRWKSVQAHLEGGPFGFSEGKSWSLALSE